MTKILVSSVIIYITTTTTTTTNFWLLLDYFDLTRLSIDLSSTILSHIDKKIYIKNIFHSLWLTTLSALTITLCKSFPNRGS